MSNSKTDYNDYVRSNLPSGMSFTNNKYRYNNHSFYTYELAEWYYNYVRGFGINYDLDGHEPTLVIDFLGGNFWCRDIDATDYDLDGTPAELILDFSRDIYATKGA